MFLYNLFVILFTFICFLLILLVLIQKGKGSMGLGAMGGGSQMLFGGSGGQDVFQKATWVLGALFIGGSLALALFKTQTIKESSVFKTPKQIIPAPAKQASNTQNKN